ncbi:sensor domain-containing diguanylate cyclase [Marinomonas aquiplantarum]|uniref:Diguanylate cyclase with GAF sensor n=1 Tax=Marinomonas aquiplantarum TaxID=491951 RepID=A0A366CVB0_9GAMM|nr:sensor domain-containing diguanylate cyclase [Marinomonas aquiplantarum]RBO80226.1 diguanylate cyclase with GAF sensor [Marinomonas aquiplantarum]
MQTPDIPIDEELRLSNLRSLGILDTDAEERFDRVTRLAQRMFDVPIALVSLVDESRQWFKSCLGLEVRETPRDISFCGHAILGSEPFIVPDASLDQRFADNPLVTGPPNVRFYAGVPLAYGDGTKMGTLCIIDQRPHYLSEQDLEALVDLAKMAEYELLATHIASVDELTQLFNRRGFIRQTQHQLTIPYLVKETFSLVYMDLNLFKPINDRFGHDEGDRALQQFAALMRENFRSSDVLSRLGGDEFVVFMPGINLETAKQVLARFKCAVEHYNQTSSHEYDLLYTAGFAVTDSAERKSIDTLLKEADQSMYAAKQNPSAESK